MFCYKYGIELPAGSAFCHKCGTKMTNGEYASAKEKFGRIVSLNKNNLRINKQA